MQKFNNIGKLGFGLMRPPMKDGEIKTAEVCDMVDSFMKAGFTYFDTAYVYLGGRSECLAKTALVERYPRDSFQLATKMPMWSIKSYDDFDKIFNEQLARTGAGYFDFYLLHALNKSTAAKCDSMDAWKWLAEKKEQGLVKHMGFSFHDTADVLDDILTRHPESEFVQLQINYADWDDEGIQSRLCYDTARKHGTPIIIMEPVKGGGLASMHEAARSVLLSADPGASVASWALRFCASLDGILTILSGMSSMEQMQDNISVMTENRPLSEAEREVLSRTLTALRSVDLIPCTDCKYCVENCPQKIAIPDIFSAYNDYSVYRAEGAFRWNYGNNTQDGGKAGDCISCAVCEDHCPQKIGIIEKLKEISAIADR